MIATHIVAALAAATAVAAEGQAIQLNGTMDWARGVTCNPELTRAAVVVDGDLQLIDLATGSVNTVTSSGLVSLSRASDGTVADIITLDGSVAEIRWNGDEVTIAKIELTASPMWDTYAVAGDNRDLVAVQHALGTLIYSASTWYRRVDSVIATRHTWLSPSVVAFWDFMGQIEYVDLQSRVVKVPPGGEDPVVAAFPRGVVWYNEDAGAIRLEPSVGIARSHHTKGAPLASYATRNAAYVLSTGELVRIGGHVWRAANVGAAAAARDVCVRGREVLLFNRTSETNMKTLAWSRQEVSWRRLPTARDNAMGR